MAAGACSRLDEYEISSRLVKPPNLGSRQPEFQALIQRIEATEPDPRIVAARIAMLCADYGAALDILNAIPSPHFQATCLIGDSLALAGKVDEAIAFIEQAEREYPISPMRRACLLLGSGRYREAYAPLRYRKIQRSPFPWPRARTMRDIRGRALFLASEQGVGDGIMFARFIAPLGKHAAGMTIGAHHESARLLADLQHSASFAGPPRGAVWCLAMDALEILGVTAKTIPPAPYLDVSADLIAARLLPATRKMRVGLCWAGRCDRSPNGNWDIDLVRSIPPEFLAPLLEVGGVEFVSLMHPGNHEPGPLSINCVVGADFDMADTAAVIVQVDLVISVDTAIAHVAGAVGTPVWLMNRHMGDWRWGWTRTERTPWYQSMRIFTQDRPYEWTPVIDRVRRELAAMT